MLYRTFIVVSLYLLSQLSMADEPAGIAGIWKHESEPGWIEINATDGTGTIIANEKYPERVGKVFLRDLEADGSGDNRWTAQVYAQQLDAYRKVKLSMPEADTLRFTVKAGFLSRSINWVRADAPEVVAADELSDP